MPAKGSIDSRVYLAMVCMRHTASSAPGARAPKVAWACAALAIEPALFQLCGSTHSKL
ncbi:MAG: hypothetical protein ACREGL_07245 [Alphaproteobacteria bacterium]